MAIMAGQRVIDFERTDISGNPFRLSDHLGQGPIVLVFNRGFS